MNCTEARSTMLTCEPAELAPGSASPLARHLGECDECRASADAIVARTAALRTALATRGGRDAARSSRRVRLIGAAALAAGILVAVSLAPRERRRSVASVVRPAPQHGTVTIDAAQGRAVTIIESESSIDVIFHTPGAQ